jgi:hypothetical protein
MIPKVLKLSFPRTISHLLLKSNRCSYTECLGSVGPGGDASLEGHEAGAAVETVEKENSRRVLRQLEMMYDAPNMDCDENIALISSPEALSFAELVLELEGDLAASIATRPFDSSSATVDASDHDRAPGPRPDLRVIRGGRAA